MKSAASLILCVLLVGGWHSLGQADEPTLSSLQQQVDDLTQQLQRLAPPPSTPWTPPPVAPATSPAPAKPTFPNARLTGLFQADIGWFDQVPSSPRPWSMENRSGISRMARISVGRVWPPSATYRPTAATSSKWTLLFRVAQVSWMSGPR